MTVRLLADLDRFLAQDRPALRLSLGGRPTRPAFEPGAVLAHPDGRATLAAVAERLRAAGWANEPDGSSVHELARGVLLPPDAVVDALGPELARRSEAAGVVVVDGDKRRLGFGALALGDLLVPVPRELPSPDMVYLGPEALYLEELRLALGAGGRVAYLGSGAGHLAAVLACSADLVVATDLLPRAAGMTAVALALNAGRLAAAHGVVVADLADGLRPGAFDLVVANPPWVPTDTGATGRVFADGGPTGCELPARFLTAGLGLLRPGGALVMCTLDPTLTDGRRPWHAAVDAAVASAGGPVRAVVRPTPIEERRPGHEARLVAGHPSLAAARHVALVAVRTDGAAGPRTDRTTGRAGVDPARLDELDDRLGPRWPAGAAVRWAT